jgi:hypothetical protein
MLLPNTPDDKLYRVTIKNDTKVVEVACIGIDRVDSEVNDSYPSVDDLPVWIQERLAVLMMMDWRPTTEPVKDVGRRIDKHTYWVVRP